MGEWRSLERALDIISLRSTYPILSELDFFFLRKEKIKKKNKQAGNPEEALHWEKRRRVTWRRAFRSLVFFL